MGFSAHESSGSRDDARPRGALSRSLTSADAPAYVVGEVHARLRAAGPLAALAWLNARTRFRFTGLYRADPPLLRNLYLVDRENPALNLSGEVCPLDETYCAIACAREASFSTNDSRHDPELVDHPARRSIISYAGVALRLAGGRAWGTLCHYDLRPRLLAPEELVTLEVVVPLFVDWLGDHSS